ncbi:MAG: FmdB family zinc ribbon protein [Dissulfurimicrobium sp.]|uniref:FmdB family zinc ribbon protein n=1 Tax=Dissulfurimicrobium TaxID=1769732 RepID=UPI001EDB96E3|nr:zinc ribbon domain-containing protein [Dissulfurimicrobium hydrothermale]UKL13200.1 zinc ribbon domain-containing protein [Dissulfurimicrobium hydrothermale]
MPIFDFFCNNCKKTFERFVSSFKDANDVHCPYCGARETKKMPSGFNYSSTSLSSGKSGLSSSCSGGAGHFGRRFG